MGTIYTQHKSIPPQAPSGETDAAITTPTTDRASTLYPSFIYAGAAKAGSSWLYEVLLEHPGVFMPPAKELMFFDRYYDQGLDWYADHYAPARLEAARGEMSHNYFLEPAVAERIHRHFPDMKLLFCLREGVDRTFSEYLYDQTIFQYVDRATYEKGLPFRSFAMRPDITVQSDYFSNLKPYFDLFPRENICVVFYDELKQDAAGFARKVFRFLQVDESFIPSMLNKKVNVAREPRSRFLAELAFKAGTWIRHSGRPGAVGLIKRQPIFEKLLYKPFTSRKKPRPEEEDVRALWPIYHARDKELEALIEQKLPPTWSRKV